MKEENSLNPGNKNQKYKVLFFAGAESSDDRFNVFTGSFIKLMTRILADDFELIKGIYYRSSFMNVIWALNNAQNPIRDPGNKPIIRSAINHLSKAKYSSDTQLIITSSSSGTIVAAQTACYLAGKNKKDHYFEKPFHLVLGASMISPRSELFRLLLEYQSEGFIGSILHDEVQDEGDSSFGVGGSTRWEAYRNATGLMFPYFSRKYKPPSFLNTHPESGHIHRKRSKTVQKALDYIKIILVDHSLAGDLYKEKAVAVLKEVII